MSKSTKIAFFFCFAVIALISIVPIFMEKPVEVAEAPPPPMRPEKKVEVNSPSPIENLAIEPYTKEDYPGVVAKFGSAIPAVNADRKTAAEIAARSDECDSVQNAQVSTRSPKANRHYWVECGPSFDRRSPLEWRCRTLLRRLDNLPWCTGRLPSSRSAKGFSLQPHSPAASAAAAPLLPGRVSL